jgi:hypothetical protein
MKTRRKLLGLIVACLTAAATVLMPGTAQARIPTIHPAIVIYGTSNPDCA